jgi:ABC-type nickel/cobalt efflux system permease component RcnA
MRRLALLLVALSLAGVAAGSLAQGAAAHPLGNFTVNRYAGIELAGGVIYVHYALDVAEIPTFQLESAIRKPGYARSVASRLVLEVDGRRVALTPLEQRVRRQPGAGGLSTLRFDAVFRADTSGAVVAFEDRLYPDRIGWREITASARDGARLTSADVPATSTSDELRAYPETKLRAPLDVRGARLDVEPGSGVAPAPRIDGLADVAHEAGGFEGLVGRGELGAGVILVSLLIAAFWGAVHALTPGHGKALVAGYLVGTRGRPRDAFLLGATVTVTHTAGVFALGLVTLALSEVIVPEQLYPWLTLVSGLLVVAVGAGVLRQRLRSGGWGHGHSHDGDGHHHHHHEHDHHHHEHDHHHHGHDHHHHGHDRHDGHTHGHEATDDRITRRGLLGVGISAGLLPCPSALVVLLGAIALHRVGFGLALIVAFSVGLAATITGIGLAAVLARRAFARARFDGPLVRALPAVSAAVILAVGVVLTVKAIPGVV